MMSEIKQAALQTLLSDGDVVRIDVNPRAPGVWLPDHLRATISAALDIGTNMAQPIPDLDLGDDAVTCTLSFGGPTCACVIPWRAIWRMALVREMSRAIVWSADMYMPTALPPAPAKPPMRLVPRRDGPSRQRPHLRLIRGGKA